MRKIVFPIMLLALTVQSCGKKAEHKVEQSQNQVLSEFYDYHKNSTFDEKKLKDLPRSINLESVMTPVKNQINRGSCAFFSTMAIVESAIKKDSKVELNLSEEYLIYTSKQRGFSPYGEDSELSNNIAVVKASGLLLESHYPYEPSWFDQGLACDKYTNTDAPYAHCFKHNGPGSESNLKIIAADAVDFIPVKKDTNEIIKFLANEKRPITFAVPVNLKTWSSGETIYNEELRQECLRDKSKCGLHAIVMTGYDLDRKVIFFKNSWGVDWGKKGYGEMPISYIDLYSGDDFYSAKLNAPLKIPAEFPAVVLKNFDYTVKYEGDELGLQIKAELDNIKRLPVYFTSMIMEKIDPNKAAVDDNMKVLELAGPEAQELKATFMRASFIQTTFDSPTVKWGFFSPLNIKFPKSSGKILKKMQSITKGEIYFRTTVYIHTDTEGWKSLKRIYTAAKKSR